jgi:hypothetical protein
MNTIILKNTSDDRTKVDVHRNAAGFDAEPSIGGVRLRRGQQMAISMEHYERIKDFVSNYERMGVITVLQAQPGGAVPLAVATDVPNVDSNPHESYTPPKSLEEAQAIERRGGSPSSLTWPPKPPVMETPVVPPPAPPAETTPVETAPVETSPPPAAAAPVEQAKAEAPKTQEQPKAKKKLM